MQLVNFFTFCVDEYMYSSVNYINRKWLSRSFVTRNVAHTDFVLYHNSVIENLHTAFQFPLFNDLKFLFMYLYKQILLAIRTGLAGMLVQTSVNGLDYKLDGKVVKF